MSTLFPLRFDIPDADKAIELSLSGNVGGIPVPIGLPGFQVFTSAAIDGVDSTSAVNVLGLSAAIRCMADRNDGYGFRQIVKRDEVQNEAQTQIANLFIPCYGDFINRCDTILLKVSRELSLTCRPQSIAQQKREGPSRLVL